MLIKLILAEVLIEEFFHDDPTYLSKKLHEASQLYLEIENSEKRKWLLEHGAKLEYGEIIDNDKSTKRMIYYAIVEESIAIMYNLLF